MIEDSIKHPSLLVFGAWHSFDAAKGSQQKRPPERRAVLCLVVPKEIGLPYVIAVGYRKNAAGDKQSPYFVVPGQGGKVLAWCDCLPETDVYTLWSTARRVAGVEYVYEKDNR